MSKDEYLITDAPLKALTVFAMPMILGSFFQQIYNMADSIIVGQFVGSSALAAVGACAALTNVFICVALGAGVGAGVLVSRYFGAKEYGKMKTIVSTSLLSFLILSIVLGVFGLCFSLPMMRGLQTPPDILDEAVLYLRVYFAGFPFLFMYNILSTMFTSIGESRIPLALLIFSSVLNIFMDLWMVAGLGLGVFGAALATILGQYLSFALALVYLWHFRTVRLTKTCFRLNLRDNLKTLYMGISSCINQVAITLVQIVLNNSLTYYGALSIYGKEIPLAACGIVMKTNAILLSIIVGISQGVQPIIGFNFGAGKYDRVRQAYLLAIKWNFVVSAVGFCLFQFFPRPIISLFGDGDPLYFEFAVLFMRTFLFMVLVNGVQLLSSNFFTAIGKALKGLLLSLTRQVFFLIPLILLLPQWLGVFGVLLAGPVADFIAFVVSVFFVRKEFKALKAQEALQTK